MRAHHSWSVSALRAIVCFSLTAALTLSTPARAVASPSAGLSVTDDRGQLIHFDKPPKRIITLLPSLSEMVCELSACDRLVATDRYANWPARVRTLPKVGGIDDTPIETVIALRPDVVLAASSSRAIHRQEELGVQVVALEPKTFADTHRVLLIVATLLGTPDQGALAWQRLQQRIQAAAGRMPAASQRKTVYFEVSDAPHAASTASFVGELLAHLGLVSVVPGSLGPFPQLNPEFVVRAQPDLIMAPIDTLDSMQARPGWSQLVAFQQHRVCGFTTAQFEILVRAGPRLAEAADDISACVARRYADKKQ
jgi:iron complex transport system substrate-binding protein